MKCVLALAMFSLAVSLSLAAEKSQSISLFDGKTFQGWEGDTNKTWRIENRAIVGGTLKERVPHNEFICTTRGYTNFVLRLKFKIVGTEGFVNGGVQVQSQRITNPAYEMRGYQIDIGDPEWWGCIYDESRRNKVVAKSDMTEVNKVLKRNDWNEYVIRCEGKRIRVSLNGYQTVDYTEPDNTIPQHGLIGLQVHGGGKTEISYKDISIEEL
ncbi:MAG: DUF1080 domain-containing protein [Verrucomicrobia bacterium]|nr:DUF1080 domain-containing protein [Verrucomicrobiota bacterium]